MCGIFGYVGKNHAQDIVFNGLINLEYRGYDSWGVGVISKNRIFLKKKTGKINGNNVTELPDGRIAFGHTRWATHGAVTKLNAHPQTDCTGRIAVVHNGIFENYLSVKKMLIGSGHKFISQTDTEVIAHLIEEFHKTNDFETSAFLAFRQIKGLNAVIAASPEADELIAMRYGSPLVLGFGKNENFIASDPSALILHTNTAQFLEDGQAAIIKNSQINIMDIYSGKSIAINPQILNIPKSTLNKGKYAHFMLKEIHEQPKIYKKIAHGNNADLNKLAKLVKTHKDIYLVGCGSAYYAAVAGSCLLGKIAGVKTTPVIGSELGGLLNLINNQSLIITLSQSGETMDLLEPVKAAAKQGATIATLVNVPGSTLWRLSDLKINLNAGTEYGVASTKAMTAKLSMLILLAHDLKGSPVKGKKILTECARAVNKILEPDMVNKIINLAKILKNHRDIFIVGRGLSFPAALESAMKIKEISYVHAEGLAGGELKHGSLALITKGTPVIVFAPADETYDATIMGAMEMKARGAWIIGISDKSNKAFDYFLKVRNCGLATIIPDVVIGQLLAYYLAKLKNLDPDRPRNLAKSVTVK